jgi:hypothetical protein
MGWNATQGMSGVRQATSFAPFRGSLFVYLSPTTRVVGYVLSPLRALLEPLENVETPGGGLKPTLRRPLSVLPIDCHLRYDGIAGGET